MDFDIRDCPMSFQKQKSFGFENNFFFIHGKCMCGGIGEDLRLEAWHVDIRI